MSIKIIGVIVTIACAIQMVHGLNCYYCITSAPACTSYKEITCTPAVANETYYMLSLLYVNVPTVTSNQYECISVNYTYSYQTVQTHSLIQTCAYTTTQACSLKPITVTGVTTATCSSCNSNGCNPAPKVMPSIFTILLVAISGLFRKLTRA